MAGANELQAALEAALGHVTGSHVEIQALALMPGGASQEMWRLDLAVAEGAWQGEYPLVMRRQVGSKIYVDALEPAAEFQVLQAAYESGVPVPRPYWLFPDLLGRAAFLMGRLEGETIGRRVVKEPGLADARKRLPGQLGAALAAIHRVDTDKFGLSEILPAPAPGQTPARFLIGRAESDLDRIGEPHPALELCLRWLRRHERPPPQRLVLVHGDFRIGNLVVTPQGLGGVLDWEFAHIGDPAEDLNWGLVRDWRFGADHLPYGGVGEPEEFFAAYEERGGAVDRARVSYWEAMGNVRWAVGTLNQAQRHLRGEEPNLELASLGRRCAEMELEALRLIKGVS
jgi:aminoglycoside phosphotransferase (APT) family kinase protein